MKEMDDEDLQKLIEQHLKSSASNSEIYNEDEQLYQAVFSALAHEPPVSTHTSLAENVVAQIKQEQEAKEAFRYNWTIAAVVTGSLMLACISLLILSPAVVNSITSGISMSKWIITFMVLSFLIIQVLDKKLVYHKH